MSHQPPDPLTIDRRRFVQATLIPAVYPWATSLMAAPSAGGEAIPESDAAGPEIVDTNVHLFDWPFRKLKYATTEALITKLRKHRITRAWAGSFDALLHKQLDQSNRRLAEECRIPRDGMLTPMLIPIGCVNPAWAGWEEDLRRCHESYGMPGVRLYPAYHGYTFDHPELARLLSLAAGRGLFVQIVLRMEDERVHHVATNLPAVNVAPLVDVLKRLPDARVQLLNAAGPLLGRAAADLVQHTAVTFDIAAVEGNGGVGRLIAGENPSYRCAVPVDRLLFGSHAPFFPCESAVMKLFESPLNREQLEKLMRGNARRFLA